LTITALGAKGKPEKKRLLVEGVNGEADDTKDSIAV
jgi:hypothetical protein